MAVLGILMPKAFTPSSDWLCRHVVEHSRIAVIYGDAAGSLPGMEQEVAEQRRDGSRDEEHYR